MPLEIRELNITVAVGQNQQSNERQTVSPVDEKQLVRKCVEKVLEVLRKENER